MVYVRILFRCDWAITTLKIRDPYPKTMNGISLDAILLGILLGSSLGQRLQLISGKFVRNRVWAFNFTCLAERRPQNPGISVVNPTRVRRLDDGNLSRNVACLFWDGEKI